MKFRNPVQFWEIKIVLLEGNSECQHPRMLVLQNFIIGLNFYFICITDILTKQYNNNEIQTLYKWDSEGSQMTYLNLNLNLNSIFGHSSKLYLWFLS